MARVVSNLLQRPVYYYQASSFEGQRVVVTGGAGSIGRQLVLNNSRAGTWSSLDLPQAYDAIGTDILDYDALEATLAGHRADVVIHAAANKHAPEGEDYPFDVADLNIRGTENVVNACLELGIKRLVFASTCKAAQPETVYGASKLVGERIVLNAGFHVARFYNVVETSRNVFRLWEEAQRDGRPCLVMPGMRRFIHLGEATAFILSCLDRGPGRYVPYSEPVEIVDLFHRWLRENAEVNPSFEHVPRRRGDRLIEPQWGTHEWAEQQADGAFRVWSHHD